MRIYVKNKASRIPEWKIWGLLVSALWAFANLDISDCYSEKGKKNMKWGTDFCFWASNFGQKWPSFHSAAKERKKPFVVRTEEDAVAALVAAQRLAPDTLKADADNIFIIDVDQDTAVWSLLQAGALVGAAVVLAAFCVKGKDVHTIKLINSVVDLIKIFSEFRSRLKQTNEAEEGYESSRDAILCHPLSVAELQGLEWTENGLCRSSLKWNNSGAYQVITICIWKISTLKSLVKYFRICRYVFNTFICCIDIPTNDLSTIIMDPLAVAKICTRELKTMVRCRDGKSFTYNTHINIAVVVAIDGGLITPVLQDADKLQPNEYTTGTFTLSNLGMFGVDRFDAILPPRTGAIMAVGSSQPTLVGTKDGRIGLKTQMQVNVTADHRVIYGADLAAFLQTLSKIIEDPKDLTL
ncbi:dihydrolipoyllysine-residue succinyltransferase component of 2-oxoglutarate dehydrogenase complex [Striga asiatica]|uniref:Dihydrolipoyllysine-residue succinyltransferase component of 2-oxoglutarate dehydrogenase complex n=1 Tax=Striga asiatica TaxID=4170 RepID=A0A5A7PZ09_STRAF|nr:dihydrolipoyllysine-residue succinyltransferase component of 2-oxoglutarate dehydrogenase complex [Striga asiatica]